MNHRPAVWPLVTRIVLLTLLLATGRCGVRRAPSRPLPVTAVDLAARRPPLAPFRAALSGRVRAPGAKGRFAVGLGAQPPDFRIDVFHPVTRATVFSIGVAGGDLRAVWPTEGECLEARATARLMGELLGLEVKPEDLLPLFTGHVYPARGVKVTPRAAATIGAGERGRMIVDVVALSGEVSWLASLVGGRDGLAVEGRRRGSDGGEIRVAYPRWVGRQAGEGSAGHPGTIRLTVPARELQLHLQVREWAAGGPSQEALLPTFPRDCTLLDERDLDRRLAPWLRSGGAGR